MRIFSGVAQFFGGAGNALDTPERVWTEPVVIVAAGLGVVLIVLIAALTAVI